MKILKINHLSSIGKKINNLTSTFLFYLSPIDKKINNPDLDPKGRGIAKFSQKNSARFARTC